MGVDNTISVWLDGSYLRILRPSMYLPNQVNLNSGITAISMQ